MNKYIKLLVIPLTVFQLISNAETTTSQAVTTPIIPVPFKFESVNPEDTCEIRIIPEQAFKPGDHANAADYDFFTLKKHESIIVNQSSEEIFNFKNNMEKTINFTKLQKETNYGGILQIKLNKSNKLNHLNRSFFINSDKINQLNKVVIQIDLAELERIILYFKTGEIIAHTFTENTANQWSTKKYTTKPVVDKFNTDNEHAQKGFFAAQEILNFIKSDNTTVEAKEKIKKTFDNLPNDEIKTMVFSYISKKAKKSPALQDLFNKFFKLFEAKDLLKFNK